MKLFVNIYEVDDRHGPFTLLPADVSARVMRGLHPRTTFASFRRYTDVEVLEFSHPSDFVTVSGAAGSAMLVDTSRCLHFGSRVRSGHCRLVYCAQFCRFHLPVLTRANHFDRERFRRDPIRWQILTPARRNHRSPERRHSPRLLFRFYCSNIETLS